MFQSIFEHFEVICVGDGGFSLNVGCGNWLVFIIIFIIVVVVSSIGELVGGIGLISHFCYLRESCLLTIVKVISSGNGSLSLNGGYLFWLLLFVEDSRLGDWDRYLDHLEVGSFFISYKSVVFTRRLTDILRLSFFSTIFKDHL